MERALLPILRINAFFDRINAVFDRINVIPVFMPGLLAFPSLSLLRFLDIFYVLR